MDGDVLSGEGDRQSDHLCVRVWIAAGLSVPGRAIRKLDRAVVGPPGRAAVADGAIRNIGQSWRGQQPVYSDWIGAADRIVGEERDPDRRGCARKASVWRTDPGCSARCGAHEVPADPDDLVRVHPWGGAAGDSDGRGGECARVTRSFGVQ